MNTSERHLRDELARAADQMPGGSIPLDGIRNRTSHRGRTVLLAAAATIAAITAPIAVVEFAGSTKPDTPVATSPSNPTTSPTDVFTPVGSVVIDIGKAPIEAQPRIVVGLHGNLGDLPLGLAKGERLVGFAARGSGWIVLVSNADAEIETRLLAADGSSVTDPWISNSWTVASGSDGSVAYVNRDGDLELDGPDGAVVQTWTLGRQQLLPMGILPDGTVALRDVGRVQQVLFANPDGTLTQVDGLLSVGGVSPGGHVAGMVEITDGGSCGIVRDVESGSPLWRTCDYTIGHFSPDGNLVIGKPAYLDGIGDSSVSILDARTGATLVDFETQRDPWCYISDAVWEDDTHLLASVYSSRDGWRVMRLGVDGSVAVAGLGDLGGGELNRPVTFPAAR